MIGKNQLPGAMAPVRIGFLHFNHASWNPVRDSPTSSDIWFFTMFFSWAARNKICPVQSQTMRNLFISHVTQLWPTPNFIQPTYFSVFFWAKHKGTGAFQRLLSDLRASLVFVMFAMMLAALLFFMAHAFMASYIEQPLWELNNTEWNQGELPQLSWLPVPLNYTNTDEWYMLTVIKGFSRVRKPKGEKKGEMGSSSLVCLMQKRLCVLFFSLCSICFCFFVGQGCWEHKPNQIFAHGYF